MRDSYQRFFSEFQISESRFFEFGLKDIIYIPIHTAKEEWAILKKKINNNEEVFIRGFGRDAKGTHLYQEFYKLLLDNKHVKKDSNNNAEPERQICQLTGCSKKSSKHKIIRNYQISHVFGRTKNVYAFTAPWNLAYVAKVVDPFTGHEAIGPMVKKFTALFQQQTYERFSPLIDDFNEIITNQSFLERFDEAFKTMLENSMFQKEDVEKLRKSIRSEFSPIKLRLDGQG